MKLSSGIVAGVALFLFAVVLMSGGCLSVSANLNMPKGQDEGGPRPQGPSKDAKPEKKPFAEVTKDCKVLPGLFTLYQKENNLYWEITPAHFGRKYIFLGSLARGIGVPGFQGGVPSESFAFELRNIGGNRIEFAMINSRFTASPGTPEALAVRHATTTSIFASLPVLSENPETKGLIVDLREKLLSDISDSASSLRGILGAEYKLDPATARFDFVKVLPKNIEIAALQHFLTPKEGYHIALPDTKNVEVVVRYSISELEESGYRPRIADDRIGYFTREIKNFSSDDPRDLVDRFIYRWHLVKQDPAAPLSPPVKPIVFWVENTTPVRHREAVRRAILAWNRAFEKAGFKDAVEAKIMPDDADWDPADIRYNVIRWITSSSSSFAGLGPARVNPLTGEILDADVLIEGESIRSMRRYYLDRMIGATGERQSSTNDFPSYACAYPLFKAMDAATALDLMTARGLIGADEIPEEFINEYIFGLVSHEVGHVLGLRHNFKASTMCDLKDLHDKKLTEERGLIGSVMEYDPVNIAPKGVAQGYYYTPVVGPYDLWAIEYGYRTIATDGPRGELPELRKIASRSGEKGHAYGTDEDAEPNDGERWGVDPYCIVYDQSSDPLGHSEQMIHIYLDLVPKIREKLLKEGENYANVRNAFANCLGSYTYQVIAMTRFVGGQRYTRSHYGDPGTGAPLAPLPAAEQRRALELIARYGFSDEHLNFPPELMNLLAPSRWYRWHSTTPTKIDFPFHEVVTSMQEEVLEALCHPRTLARLAAIEEKTPDAGDALTIPEIFAFLRGKIWAELERLDGAPATNLAPRISRLRRNLQRLHADRLIGLMFSEEKTLPGDARTLAWSELERLRDAIAAAVNGAKNLDDYTAAHLRETQAKIVKALDARMAIPAR